MRFPLRLVPPVFRQLGCLALLLASAGLSLNAAVSPQQLRWLDQVPKVEGTGATLGAAWPKGALKADTRFSLTDASGKARPVQSWTLATWPDGSVKWSAHSFVAGPADATSFTLAPLAASSSEPAPANPVVVRDSESSLEIDTGLIKARIPRTGPVLIDRLQRDGRDIAVGGGLVLWRQDQPGLEPGQASSVEAYHGQLTRVTVEQSGPVRAVVRLEGIHRSDTGSRAWLPFRVRLYFYAGSDSVRVLTPSSSTVTSTGTSSAASACASVSRCTTNPTTATSVSRARATACLPRPCRASPACAAIRAARCERHRWPAAPRPPSPPGATSSLPA